MYEAEYEVDGTWLSDCRIEEVVVKKKVSGGRRKSLNTRVVALFGQMRGC